MINGVRRPVPGAPSSGTPRESQAKFRDGAVWDCRRVLCFPGPRGQYSGTIQIKEKPGVQDEAGRHEAKHSSEPRVAYPEVKGHVRDKVRVVDSFAPFAQRRVDIRGKFVLSSPRGKMGIGNLCRVPPAAKRHGRARQSSDTGPCGDCRTILWVPGPRG